MPADQTTSASYREALKATSITGTSSVIEVAVGMIKSKVIAVCVGPEGIGLFGILTAATGLVGALTNFGLNTSGVRQVAAASATNDQHKIARVIYTLRRTSTVCGLLGMIVVLALAKPIAQLTTGSASNAGYLMLLAPLILFQNVNAGQTTLLRGLRRIGDLARIRIIGAIAATVFSVPLVLAWGINGIAPAMLATALAGLGVSWWYARKVRMPSIELTFREILGEGGALFSLGAAFLLTGLQGPIVQNAFRAILVHRTDIHTVGQFLAASALSHVYVNFVLQAMGLDYLPRLTRYKDNKAEINRLVNEQTEIALLLAVPGVTALVVFAPLLIPIFYSGRFTEAVEVFQWQCLGVLLKVASWALGYVLIALGLRTAYLLTETVTNAVYVGVFYLLVQHYALTGAALTFAVVYIWYLTLIYITVRVATGFTWSPGARRILLGALGSYCLATSILLLPSAWKWVAGVSIVSLTAAWTYRELCGRTGVPLVGKSIQHCNALLQRTFRPKTGATRP